MSIESKTFEKLALGQIYGKAEKSLAENEINPDDFIDLYGKEGVEKDKKYVEEMEKKFGPETDIEKLAVIFEAILYENAEMSEWLGPEAVTIKSSRYDDIVNGVDSIAEFQESESSASYLALAVDATFSPEVVKKFDRIKEEIDRGELAKIKYFQSEHMNIRGELAKIPRVVIGADAKTVLGTADLWIENKKKELGVHPIQFQILEEIILQMEVFNDYAKSVNRSEVSAIYEKSLKLIRGIYEEKKKSIVDTGERDRVFYAIHDNLKRFAK